MKNLLLLIFILLSTKMGWAQRFDFLPKSWNKIEVTGSIQFKEKGLKAFKENGDPIELPSLSEYLSNSSLYPLFYGDTSEEVKAIVFVSKEGKNKNNLPTPKNESETPNRHKGKPLMLGETAPDFQLTTLYGKEVKLSDYADRPILLNFWFTSCAPCIEEIPELNELVDKYQNQGVVFLAIGLDHPKRVKPFLKKHPFQYEILTNGLRVAQSYKVNSYPTHLLLNSQREVVYSQVGYARGVIQSIEMALKKLIE